MQDRKEEILHFIKAHGQATLSQVADHAGISKQAALRHLETLQARDLVTFSSGQATGPGRPEHVYRLTESALEHFPQAHRELAGELVHFLRPPDLERFFQARAARLEREYSSRLAGLNFEDRVSELARLASEHGHMAEVVTEPDGSVAIRHGHCPIADVAGETSSPCRHEQDMYQRLLGTEVERTTYIPDAATSCTYRIKPAGAGGVRS
jgi:predicted ArsR family transcriptional regulator